MDKMVLSTNNILIALINVVNGMDSSVNIIVYAIVDGFTLL